ncbi:MAG: alpha/beta hydrolase [Clostridiales bacterium]|nr:alpha/beta hydrolase [Candidatus Blautia equi]
MNVKKRIPIWDDGEYQYQGAGAFVPNLTMYLHTDEEARPAMIVCPGGGYFLVSPTEGELVAKKFFGKGYNCFVLTYTTNPLADYPLLDQPVKDLSRAIRYVRAHAKDFRIITDQVYICGFSAAGHLCGTICDYHQEIMDENPKYREVSNRPDAAILSYPVITSGEMAHQDSFRFLIDRKVYDREDAEAAAMLDRYSLEKHVTADNPPTFLWHTATDGLVPVENSYLYAMALKEKGVHHALHIFSDGHHGLSVADEEWACGKSFGELYTFDQFLFVKEAMEDGSLPVTPERKAQFTAAIQGFFKEGDPDHPIPEVTIWPDLADAFIKAL